MNIRRFEEICSGREFSISEMSDWEVFPASYRNDDCLYVLKVDVSEPEEEEGVEPSPIFRFFVVNEEKNELDDVVISKADNSLPSHFYVLDFNEYPFVSLPEEVEVIINNVLNCMGIDSTYCQVFLAYEMVERY